MVFHKTCRPLHKNQNHQFQVAGTPRVNKRHTPQRNMMEAAATSAVPRKVLCLSKLFSPIIMTPLLPNPMTKANGMRVQTGGWLAGQLHSSLSLLVFGHLLPCFGLRLNVPSSMERKQSPRLFALPKQQAGRLWRWQSLSL